MPSIIGPNFSEMLKGEKSVHFSIDISCMHDKWKNK